MENLSKKTINALIIFLVVFIVVMVVKPENLFDYSIKLSVIFTIGCSLIASIGYLLAVMLSNRKNEDTWLYLNDDIKYFLICDVIIVVLIYCFINTLMQPEVLNVIGIDDKIAPIDYLLLKIILFTVSITIVLAIIFNVNSQYYIYRLFSKESIKKDDYIKNNVIIEEEKKVYHKKFRQLLIDISHLNIIRIKKENENYTLVILTHPKDTGSYCEKSLNIPFLIFNKYFKNHTDYYVNDTSIFNLRFIESIDVKKRYLTMTHFKLKFLTVTEECDEIKKRLSIIDS